MSAEERRHPAAFPLDDRPIYDAYVAGRQSAALTVGVRVGLFDKLDQTPLDLQSVAAEFDFSLRGARSLLVALEAMGVVTCEEGLYGLSPEAAAYAVHGRSGSLVSLIELEMDHFLSPTALLEALRKDDSTAYGDADPWEEHERDPEAAARFTAAMHSVSERPAAGFAEVAPLEGIERLLDVGGGSGALCLASASAHPDLNCTVWDLQVVCDLAEKYADEAGLSEQVRTLAGDMWNEPFPDGHDAVLLSQILHDWSHEQGGVLLDKAFACLPPGGRVLIHEKLVDEDGGPLANALVNLDMLVWTKGQQYTRAELEELLLAAGFEGVQCEPTAGYWSLVWARKP